MPETAPQPDPPISPDQLPWQLRILRLAFRALAAVSPSLAGRWALRLFCTPRRYPTPPRERKWLESAEPFTVTDAQGRRIAAWRWNPAGRRIVLLVHGWEGRGGQMAAFAEPLVASGHQVVTFDATAHGRSEGRRSSLPEHATATAAVARAAIQAVAEAATEEETAAPDDPHRPPPSHPSLSIIAHSFGTAATSLALHRSWLQADRLVFIAAAGDLDPYPRGLCRLLGGGEQVQEAMLSRLEERFEVDWQEMRHITVLAGDPAARSKAPTGELAPDQTTPPLLLIHDRDDSETPPENGEILRRAWPEAELLTTEGLGHRRILRDSGVVARVVGWVTPAASTAPHSSRQTRTSW